MKKIDQLLFRLESLAHVEKEISIVTAPYALHLKGGLTDDPPYQNGGCPDSYNVTCNNDSCSGSKNQTCNNQCSG